MALCQLKLTYVLNRLLWHKALALPLPPFHKRHVTLSPALLPVLLFSRGKRCVIPSPLPASLLLLIDMPRASNQLLTVLVLTVDERVKG